MQSSDLPRGTKQAKAHALVQQAMRQGALKQEPCELCGADEAVAHHDDYDEPLTVRWLCRRHHTLIHNALNVDRGPSAPVRFGPSITSRKLRENLADIEAPVMVVRLNEGEYVKLGLWIPAKALPAE